LVRADKLRRFKQTMKRCQSSSGATYYVLRWYQQWNKFYKI